MSKAKKVAAGRRSSAQLDGNVGIRCARLPGQSFPRDQTFANRRSQTKPSICWLLLTLLLSPFTTSAQTPSSPLAVPSASWGAGIGVPHLKRDTTQRFQLAPSFSETSRQETWNALAQLAHFAANSHHALSGGGRIVARCASAAGTFEDVHHPRNLHSADPRTAADHSRKTFSFDGK